MTSFFCNPDFSPNESFLTSPTSTPFLTSSGKLIDCLVASSTSLILAIFTPVLGYLTSPLSSNCLAMSSASLTGMAKAIPSTLSISIFKDAIPTNLLFYQSRLHLSCPDLQVHLFGKHSLTHHIDRLY